MKKPLEVSTFSFSLLGCFVNQFETIYMVYDLKRRHGEKHTQRRAYEREAIKLKIKWEAMRISMFDHLDIKSNHGRLCDTEEPINLKHDVFKVIRSKNLFFFIYSDFTHS